MRILLIYPGHAFSTLDVATGYRAALTELGHEVQVFNYLCTAMFYQVATDAYRDAVPDYDPPASVARVLASEHVAIEAVDFVPDVVLAVHGLALHRRGYELLRRLSLPVVLLLTESPYADEAQAGLIRNSHAVAALTNDLNSVEPLFEATGTRAVYLPHAYNPERHYPQAVGEEYRSDVFFHGSLWPERAAAFAGLRGQPGVQIAGLEGIAEGVASGAVMHNAELARYYCGTRIALNHHRTLKYAGNNPEHIAPGAAWSLGPRAFEIAACGAFQLCDDTRPELRRVFGDSVATYADAASLTEAVRYYLAHDAERTEMAAEARRRVQGCSFADRAKEIVIPLLEEVANGST